MSLSNGLGVAFTALNHQARRSGSLSRLFNGQLHCHAGHPPYPQYQQATFPGYQQAAFQPAQRRPVSAHAYQLRAQPEPEVATVVFLDADGEPAGPSCAHLGAATDARLLTLQ